MRRYIFIVLLVVAALQASATTFHTKQLQRIAAAVHLNADSLTKPGVYTVGTYNGRPLHVRVNRLGDISNVGYRLFGEEMLEGNPQAKILDFAERYFLELDLRLDGRNPQQRMDIDKVMLTQGSIAMAKSIKPSTAFSINQVKRRMYTLQWTLSGKKLSISFPADCQLILGADAVELENIMVRDLPRTSVSVDTLSYTDIENTSSNKTLGVVKRGYYLSNAISGDLYMTYLRGKWQLVCSQKNASRSISNIMLTGQFRNILPLKLKVDKYGYKSDTLTITVQQFVNYCMAEGCKLYFGIKAVKDGILSGTLFTLNENLAYNHVLSIEFPLSIISGNLADVTGTVYAYIPLQNVTERFFTKDLKDEYENHK